MVGGPVVHSWNRHICTVGVAIQCVKGIDNISYQWLAQHSTLPRIEATRLHKSVDTVFEVHPF